MEEKVMKKSVYIRIAVLVVVMLLTGAAVFAAEVSILWSWSPSQEGVTAFRYQLDGEENALWTVVDASVTTYESGPVDSSIGHTLYVQQSLDGTHWSSSGAISFDPMEYAASTSMEMIPEPAAAPEPEKKELAETAAPKPVPVVESAPEPVELSVAAPSFVDVEQTPEEVLPPMAQKIINARRSGIEISGFAGGKADNYVDGTFFDPDDTYADLRTRILPALSLDYIIDNFSSWGSSAGIGIRLGAGYQRYQESASATYIHFFDLHALGKLDFSFNDKVSMEAGLGVAAVVPYANLKVAAPYTFDFSAINFFYGPVAEIGIRYRFTDALSIGAVAEARFLFSDAFKPYELTGTVRASVGYRF